MEDPESHARDPHPALLGTAWAVGLVGVAYAAAMLIVLVTELFEGRGFAGQKTPPLLPGGEAAATAAAVLVSVAFVVTGFCVRSPRGRDVLFLAGAGGMLGAMSGGAAESFVLLGGLLAALALLHFVTDTAARAGMTLTAIMAVLLLLAEVPSSVAPWALTAGFLAATAPVAVWILHESGPGLRIAASCVGGLALLAVVLAISDAIGGFVEASVFIVVPLTLAGTGWLVWKDPDGPVLARPSTS